MQEQAASSVMSPQVTTYQVGLTIGKQVSLKWQSFRRSSTQEVAAHAPLSGGYGVNNYFALNKQRDLTAAQ
jgi:hypothetical protein